MEGGGYGVRYKLDLMKKFGVIAKELRIDGGGAGSPLWRKIISDIAQVPVVLTETVEDGPAIGAAILGAVATKTYESLDEAVGTMVRIKNRILPDASTSEVYDGLYEKYRELVENRDNYIGY